jgi:hypothetical protein
MIKNILILIALSFALFSCSKEEGEGGRSSIAGTISGTEISIAQAEMTVITAIPGEEVKHQDFMLLNTPTANDNYAIWFRNTSDAISPPNFSDRTLVQIDYTKASSTNIDLAISIEAALNSISENPFTVSRINDIITVICNTTGSVADGDNGTSSLGVDVTVQGKNQITLQSGAFADEDVFLVYGNTDLIYDDNIKTNYDGTFKFTNLRKGAYTVFAYSKDEASIDNILTPIFVAANISGNEDANVGTITIEKK